MVRARAERAACFSAAAATLGAISPPPFPQASQSAGHAGNLARLSAMEVPRGADVMAGRDLSGEASSFINSFVLGNCPAFFLLFDDYIYIALLQLVYCYRLLLFYLQTFILFIQLKTWYYLNLLQTAGRVAVTVPTWHCSVKDVALRSVSIKFNMLFWMFLLSKEDSLYAWPDFELCIFVLLSYVT